MKRCRYVHVNARTQAAKEAAKRAAEAARATEEAAKRQRGCEHPRMVCASHWAYCPDCGYRTGG